MEIRSKLKRSWTRFKEFFKRKPDVIVIPNSSVLDTEEYRKSLPWHKGIFKHSRMAKKFAREQIVLNMKVCKDENEMKLLAGKICKNYLKGPWMHIDPADIEFKRISGGLSNFLYYVALPPIEKHPFTSRGRPFKSHKQSPTTDKESEVTSILPNKKCTEVPRKVLLRIYGQVHGPRAMDAIVTESVIFTLLSERRLGPKLYGVFSGGRIEEFIPARPLLTQELGEPSYSMKIAQKMAAIHSIEVPLSKEPNWLWKTINNWLNTVATERLTDANIDAASEEEREIIKKLREVNWAGELEWLKRYIEDVHSPVMFCHNDLQEGNILIMDDPENTDEEEQAVSINQLTEYYLQTPKPGSHDEDDANTSDSVSSHISDNGEPKLVIIDYEYCAYNYRGFDIANHFQEWLYDYTNPEKPYYYEMFDNTPTLEQKEIFIKAYLKHYNEIPENHVQDPTVTIDEVNHILSEVEAFALVSHYFWTLWSMVNAGKSQITFGYWEYASSRLELYYRLKQEAMKKDKYGVSVKRKICEVDI